MRVISNSNSLKLVAISGTYVVTLGFHLPEEECEGLLGFSIHRADHVENESYFLQGMKCFEETDPGFPAGSLYDTSEQPIQGFQWADYSAKPGYDYTYTVTALKGTPSHLEEYISTSIDISTEKPNEKEHDVYFNRGTAASQEYVRRFGNKSPKEVPNNAAFKWLSRGLYEAMVSFVERCEPGKHSLRLAVYEFKYEPFLKVLKKALDKGIDIEIVYDARKDSPGIENEKLIKTCGLSNVSTPRTEGKSFISHNKFIIKLQNNKPVCVWTGGTNISDGGIFGHSNVAHVVDDKDVAQVYLDYWNLLADDLITPEMRDEVQKLTGIPTNPPPKGTTVIFSPRSNLDLLNYYSDLAMYAKEGLFMTFAFGINDLFKDVLKNSMLLFDLHCLRKQHDRIKRQKM